VGIAQLIRGVNVALGQGDCPSPAGNACTCCACDFGGGDIQCGALDTDCAECVFFGGTPASSCSICDSDCGTGNTLCNNNPQHCQLGPPQCQCCACDFGSGDIQCGVGDFNCAECVSAGGTPAEQCTICADSCAVSDTVCTDDPLACQPGASPAPTPTATPAVRSQSLRSHYEPGSAAARMRKHPYQR
jgi:hypothetical protein